MQSSWANSRILEKTRFKMFIHLTLILFFSPMPAPECITTAFKQVAFHYQTTARYNTTNLRSLLKVVINHIVWITWRSIHPSYLVLVNIVQTVTFLLTNQVENIVYTLGHQGSFFLKIHSPPTKIKMISACQAIIIFLQTFANAESCTTHVSLQKCKLQDLVLH